MQVLGACMAHVTHAHDPTPVCPSLNPVPSPGGLHEWGAARLGLMVDVGVPLYQQRHHFLMPLPTGQRERRVVIAARGHVDLRPRVQQQASGLLMTLPETARGKVKDRKEAVSLLGPRAT